MTIYSFEKNKLGIYSNTHGAMVNTRTMIFLFDQKLIRKSTEKSGIQFKTSIENQNLTEQEQPRKKMADRISVRCDALG